MCRVLLLIAAALVQIGQDDAIWLCPYLDEFNELLPGQERVLGREHPDTLRTRNNMAALTRETGDTRETLRLCKKLLPDLEWMLGPDHPYTRSVRNAIRSLEA